MSKLARAVELKAELVHFATSGRFGRELDAVLDRFYADGPPADEAAAFLPVDFFAHQHELSGGGTVIDRFLAEVPGLDRADVELLTSWKTVVEGVYEVRAVDGAAALLFNLVTSWSTGPCPTAATTPSASWSRACSWWAG